MRNENKPEEKRVFKKQPKKSERIGIFNHQAAQAGRDGNLSKAIRLSKSALELDGKNLETLTALGKFYTAQGDYPQAFHYFWQGLDVQPRYIRAYIGIGALLMKQEKFSEAIEKFEEIFLIEPFNEAAQNGIDNVYAEMKKDVGRSGLLMTLSRGLNNLDLK